MQKILQCCANYTVPPRASSCGRIAPLSKQTWKSKKPSIIVVPNHEDHNWMLLVWFYMLETKKKVNICRELSKIQETSNNYIPCNDFLQLYATIIYFIRISNIRSKMQQKSYAKIQESFPMIFHVHNSNVCFQ